MPKRSAVRCNNSVVLFDNLDKKWWLLVRNFHRSWFGMIVRGAFNAPYFSERQHEKNMSHGKVVSGAGNVNVLLGGQEKNKTPNLRVREMRFQDDLFHDDAKGYKKDPMQVFIQAMLGGLILVVFLICYCCHRNMRKSECSYTEYWQEEVEQEMPPNEVFTLDGQCHESLGVFLPTDPCASFEAFVMPHTPTPPPAYDAVVGKKNSFSFDSGLPSYEAALKLEAQGYV